MNTYIIRPKLSLANRALTLTGKKLTASSRAQQVSQLSKLRQSDPVDRELRKWVRDATTHNKQVQYLSKGESHTRITGTTVLKLPDSEANRLRQELTDVEVITDRPIELIRPQKATMSTIKKAEEVDVWHLHAIGLKTLQEKGFKETGQGVMVAVLDTGVQASHLELKGKVKGSYTFDVDQWKAKKSKSSKDTEGHGTHVAGLICGKTVGVAKGANVVSGIMIPKGFGNLSDFILALEWAGTNPEVQIVNMSAGIPGYLPEMRGAITDLLAIGLLPVIATGNEGRNRTRSPGNYIEILSVGASNRQNHVSSFSSGGVMVADAHQYTVPDLVAPGEGVYSCVLKGGYEAWDGTSMATPIVSGVAALLLEKYPTITITDLIETLLETCLNLTEPVDRQGRGLVQVT
jgi:subtilisin family serine protease